MEEEGTDDEYHISSPQSAKAHHSSRANLRHRNSSRSRNVDRTSAPAISPGLPLPASGSADLARFSHAPAGYYPRPHMHHHMQERYHTGMGGAFWPGGSPADAPHVLQHECEEECEDGDEDGAAWGYSSLPAAFHEAAAYAAAAVAAEHESSGTAVAAEQPGSSATVAADLVSPSVGNDLQGHHSAEGLRQVALPPLVTRGGVRATKSSSPPEATRQPAPAHSAPDPFAPFASSTQPPPHKAVRRTQTHAYGDPSISLAMQWLPSSGTSPQITDPADDSFSQPTSSQPWEGADPATGVGYQLHVPGRGPVMRSSTVPHRLHALPPHMLYGMQEEVEGEEGEGGGPAGGSGLEGHGRSLVTRSMQAAYGDWEEDDNILVDNPSSSGQLSGSGVAGGRRHRSQPTSSGGAADGAHAATQQGTGDISAATEEGAHPPGAASARVSLHRPARALGGLVQASSSPMPGTSRPPRRASSTALSSAYYSGPMAGLSTPYQKTRFSESGQGGVLGSKHIGSRTSASHISHPRRGKANRSPEGEEGDGGMADASSSNPTARNQPSDRTRLPHVRATTAGPSAGRQGARRQLGPEGSSSSEGPDVTGGSESEPGDSSLRLVAKTGNAIYSPVLMRPPFAGAAAGGASRGAPAAAGTAGVPLADGLRPVGTVATTRAGNRSSGRVTPPAAPPADTLTSNTPLSSVGAEGAPGASNTAAHAPGAVSGSAPSAQTAHGAAAAAPLGAEEQLQSFLAYLVAEARPGDKLPTADVVWGQTERDRVYNFLLYVPYQLERLIQFGTLLCLDSFLALFTVMPARVLWALGRLALAGRCRDSTATAGTTATTAATAGATAATATAAGAGVEPGAGAAGAASGPSGHTTPRSTTGSVPAAAWEEGGKGAAPAQAASGTLAPPQSPLAGGQASKPVKLHSSQVFDILCLLILFGGTLVLRAIKPGFIYYWLKDITSEFLKMSVLSSAFEIADKILANFGLDVLEALSGTCTHWVAGRRGAGRQLAADAVVAFGITVLHAVMLMCQGLVLAVALNSRKNGLLALLIANNFVEIKGAVFKRWDVPRIWGLVCQDIVERLHLLAVIGFVVVEDMDSSSSWVPGTNVLRESARILASEVVIDVLKHAVLGKFNDVRPGIYREYMKDLCDKAVAAQSHSLHKLLGFHHLAPGCLLLRTLTTLFWLRLDAGQLGQVVLRMGAAAGIWGCLLLIKPLMGYTLKLVAHNYVRHYQRTHTKTVPRPAAMPRGAGAADHHATALHHHHHHRLLRESRGAPLAGGGSHQGAAAAAAASGGPAGAWMSGSAGGAVGTAAAVAPAGGGRPRVGGSGGGGGAHSKHE